MKDNAMKELPEWMPDPKAGWVYVGLGPIKGCLPLGYTSPNIACFDEGEWDHSGWGGTNKNIHYAVRIGSKVARLNGIPDHNWIARSEREPTDRDYPIWFQSGGRVYLARQEYSTDRGIPLGLGSSQPQDQEYTHWQPAIAPEPIKVEPKLSVMERLLLEDDIRKAEEALAAMRKKLGGAQ